MSRSDQPNRGRSIARWATALVAIAGIVVAWYLTELHIQAEVGDSIGGALCDAHQMMDCESALHSDFADIFGIPIALLGAAFYAGIVVLAFFDPRSQRQSTRPFRPAAISTTLFGAGVVYSIFLAVVSLVDVGTICPFCAMLYGVNILGLLTSCLWAGQWPKQIVVAQFDDTNAFYNGWTGLFCLVYGVVLVLGMMLVDAEIGDRVAEQQRTAEATQDDVETIDPDRYRSARAPAKGPEDAPVHLVEFSNFTCPFCRELAGEVGQLADAYEDELRVEFRHFPLETQQYSRLAAKAAHCADEQDQFWPMHDRLFANQQELSPGLIDESAEQMRLDIEAFEACLDDEQTGERIDDDLEAASEVGVGGTPTFFINGRRYEGVVSYDTLVDVVDEELDE